MEAAVISAEAAIPGKFFQSLWLIFLRLFTGSRRSQVKHLTLQRRHSAWQDYRKILHASPRQSIRLQASHVPTGSYFSLYSSTSTASAGKSRGHLAASKHELQRDEHCGLLLWPLWRWQRWQSTGASDDFLRHESLCGKLEKLPTMHEASVLLTKGFAKRLSCKLLSGKPLPSGREC